MSKGHDTVMARGGAVNVEDVFLNQLGREVWLAMLASSPSRELRRKIEKRLGRKQKARPPQG